MYGGLEENKWELVPSFHCLVLRKNLEYRLSRKKVVSSDTLRAMSLELKSVVYIVMINKIIIKYRTLLSLAVLLLTSFSDPKLFDFLTCITELILQNCCYTFHRNICFFPFVVICCKFSYFFQFRQCENFPAV